MTFYFFLDEIVVAHLTWKALQVIIGGQSWVEGYDSWLFQVDDSWDLRY